MAQAIFDIDALTIDRDRRKRQSCELEPVPCERETRILHPNFPPLEAEHTERQPEAAAEAAGDDDLGRRTFDAGRDGEIGGYFPPQIRPAARVPVQGRRYDQIAPEGLESLGGVDGYIAQSSLPATLVDLV